MKEPNYWQQFLNTGKISDYLYFKKEAAFSQDGSGVNTGGTGNDMTATGRNQMAGDNPYAGTGGSDRDGFEDSAYRGLR